MAFASAPLRQLLPQHELLVEAPFERLRTLGLTLAATEGHSMTMGPDMCFYRFSKATTFNKAATFGVTLGVVLQGTKRLRLGQQEFKVDPMRALVITRDSEHEVALSGQSSLPFVGMSLCFSPERVARALLALAEAGGPDVHEAAPAFVMPFDEPFADALERLLRTLADPLDRKVLAPLIIDELLYRLLRSDAAAAVRRGVGQAADAARILEAMRFIREHYSEGLSVPRVARHAGMSASHFAHRFRAVARISPMRYLREVRLERAREMLLQQGARAGEVGMSVGFESPAHFTREFKRRFGVPPSHFLRPQ